eukprot:GHVS01071597.1.p1 GENE.GHVS01071597.1~~GHVS01071597.1.p1  ORF type:complete len:418 (+),score=57.05 GHVS01071597.1:145-1254(+)
MLPSTSPTTTVSSNNLESVPSDEVFNPFMNAALSCALAGITNEHGGPFGACITRNGIILTVAHNRVLSSLDPTAHAEMECIRQASRVIQSHDLSECELYTSCEPCPMCWGACKWGRIKKVHIGAQRSVAAEFGFDDAAFFEELALPYEQRACAGSRGVREQHVEDELVKPSTTYRRRLCSGGEGTLATIYEAFFLNAEESQWKSQEGAHDDETERFMNDAVAVAKESTKQGISKEKEPFGAVVVCDGKIVARSCNTVLRDRDPTCTAEINAIRNACNTLQTKVLQNCEMYTTVEPDLMSFGAIYWARIDKVHAGISLRRAAAHGFEEGFFHYKDLQHNTSVSMATERNVMPLACRQVFVRWKELEGNLY